MYNTIVYIIVIIAITIGIMLLLFDELNNYFKLKH